MKATLNANLHVVSADQELAGVLSAPAASVLNRPFAELLWPEDREAVLGKLNPDGKRTIKFECGLRHSSGMKAIPVIVSAKGLDLNIVLRDTKGKNKPSPASHVGEPDNEEEQDAPETISSPGEREASIED